MKKILILFLVFCLSTLSASHTYGHVVEGVQAHDHLGVELNDHTHQSSDKVASHNHASEDEHLHLGNFYFRSHRLLNQVFLTKFLISAHFIDSKQLYLEYSLPATKYFNPPFYNSPDRSRNLPLLI